MNLGLPLAHGRNSVWWPAGAIYAADFINNRYMRNGVEIDRASAFSFSRSTPKLAEDSKGVWHSFGIDVPAITDRGLLLEPAATNMVANPTMAGAIPGVIGAGGALPTGWSTTNFSPVEVIDTGWEDGLPYITLRLRYNNTTGSVQFPCVIPVVGVPANLGEHWTASVFYKLISGSWHTNPVAFLNIREAGSTIVYPSASRPSGLSIRTRVALNWNTTRSGLITLDLRGMMFNVASGEAGDVTTRIYSPMLCNEINASSAIVSAGQVRSLDVMTVDAPAGTTQLTLSTASGSDIDAPASSGTIMLPVTTGSPLRRITCR